MPRPVLPDTLTGVLRDHDSRLGRLGNGTQLLELGDPSGPPTISGLGLATAARRDSFGRDTAEVSASWDPIVADTSENADSSEAPVRDYLVSYSTDGGSTYGGEASTQATNAVIQGLQVGRLIFVRVRARTTAGVTGPFATASITTAKDAEAPGKPSTPTTSAVLAGIQVNWDGLLAGGAQPPSDTRMVRVYVADSAAAAVTEAAFVGEMGFRERRYTHPVRDYSKTFFAALRLVDRDGNVGAFSDASNGTKPGQVITDDIREDVTIKGEASGTFGGGNGVLNSSFEANAPTGSDENGNATGGGPDPFRSWTETVGSFSVAYDGGFHKDRRARLGRASGGVSYLRSNGIKVAESGPAVVSAWVRLDTAGLTPRIDLVSSVGVAPVLADKQPEGFQLDPALAGTWQRIALAYKSQPRGGTVHLRVLLDSGPNGSIDVDAVQYELGNYVTAYAPNVEELLPGSIGPTQIAPGSVTSEKIIAGAIVAGKIQANAIGANEIRAGSINSSKAFIAEGTILSAMIGESQIDEARIGFAQVTSAEIREVSAERITTGTLRASTQVQVGDPGGNRVQIDYDGIRLITRRFGYDEVTVALDRATGTGRFQGEISASTITGSTLRTGDSGNYIKLSDLAARDKIQFVRADNGNYIAATLTSVYAGLVIDGSNEFGGPGRVVLGSTNGDQVISFARRLCRSDTHIRAGTIALNIPTTGLDVGWPGGAFQNGVIPDAVSVQVYDARHGDPGNTGAGVGWQILNVSQSGFRIYLTQGATRVAATRTVSIYAEALLFA